MKEEKDENLRDVMRSERRRGKPRSAQAIEDERFLRAKLSKALAAGTERDFTRILRDELGVTESSPNFSQILQIWREQR